MFLLIPILALGSIGSVFVRYRRAASRERHQLAWIALGAVVFLGVYGCMLILLVGFDIDDSSPLGNVLTSLVQAAYAAIPTAIGIAVLRHRLYDIDFVINRALVYAALTATLGVAYLATVLVLQLALGAAHERIRASPWPPRRSRWRRCSGPRGTRIQRSVDRRFFRQQVRRGPHPGGVRRAFRAQVDLDALSDDLRGVVERTVQPSHVSLWLRPPR